MELLNPLSKADYPSLSVAYTGTAGNTSHGLPARKALLFGRIRLAISKSALALLLRLPARQSRRSRQSLLCCQPTRRAPWRVSAIQVSTGGTVYCQAD
jgi:hypothetical protein